MNMCLQQEYHRVLKKGDDAAFDVAEHVFDGSRKMDLSKASVIDCPLI